MIAAKELYYARIREIRADPKFEQVQRCVECLFNRTHGMTDPHEITLKVRTENLAHEIGLKLGRGEYSYFNLDEMVRGGFYGPIVQYMLDLLHTKMVEDQLGLENLLDEVPIMKEWFISGSYVINRVMNRGL
ncbi:hypothetical protein FWD07_02940 [Candidatus Saccharibacteria bacterium]|nr:hypothetical protein [Candidatus Saccharibacteria bacterium]